MDNTTPPFEETLEAPVGRSRPSRKKRPYWLIILAAAVLALGIIPRMGQAQKLHSQAEAAKSEQPAVRVEQLSLGTDQGLLALPSNLQAIDQTSINARISGYVVQRFVDIGSVVKKGDLLAVIESPDLDSQYGQSEAQAAQSRASLQATVADSAKQQAAVTGAVADIRRSEAAKSQAIADLAHAQAKRAEAESSIKVARAKVIQAQRRLSEVSAGRSRAKAAFALAQKTLNRWKELEKAKAVSGQDVDEKQEAFDSSQANVEAAEASVSTAEAELTAAQENVVGAMADAKAAEADVLSSQGKVDAAAAAIGSARANAQASRASYQATRAQISSASSAVTSSEANAQRLRYLQGYERIVAPFDGVITARNVDVGDLVNGGSSSGATDQTNAVTHSGLFGLARPQTMRAIVNVPEDSASGIKEGQRATLTVQEWPGKTFVGTVFHVSGALDASTRTLTVEVRVLNPGLVLKPGMYAQVTFGGKAGSTHVWLPADSLIFDAKGTRAAVVLPDGTLHYALLTLGRDLGDRIEILSGLTGTEKVVLNPDSSLPEGAKVAVVEAKR